MQQPIYITQDGLDNLKVELKQLKEVRVPEVAKKIKTARDFGDISENSAYDEAKQEQAIVEGKIKELEEIIKNAVVSEATGTDSVEVGSKVLLHLEGKEMELHIVGAMEADPTKRKISHESPIGQALLGKKLGDKIEVQAPVGMITYTIKEIK